MTRAGTTQRRTAAQAIVLVAGLLLIAVFLWQQGSDPAPTSGPTTAASPRAPSASSAPPSRSAVAKLPPQAREVLRRISAGGRFDYGRDGDTFGNRERLLPQHPRGYYREYTVPTPGDSGPGARRIVTGGDPVQVAYYTADHYQSFTRIEGYP